MSLPEHIIGDEITIGFVGMMTNKSNENVMRFFFDTLSDLTILYIDTLKIYSITSDVNWRYVVKFTE